MVRDERDHALEQEILEEKAASLARVAKRTEAALEAFREADRQMERTGSAEPEHIEQRSSRLRDAAESLWELIVQRESLGITDHSAILSSDKVPPEVRKRMGSKRR
jgi:hypothetical protein